MDLIVDPKCPEALQLRQGNLIVGCKHNFVPYAYISPSGYYFSSYNYGEYEIKDLNFYTQWFGFFQNTKVSDQPIIDDLDLPAGHKMSLGTGSEGHLQYLFKDFYGEEVKSHFFLDALFVSERLYFQHLGF